MDFTLLVVKPGSGGKWENTLVPDVGVDVESLASFQVKSNKITWGQIVPREGKRNDKRGVIKRVEELPAIGMVIGMP